MNKKVSDGVHAKRHDEQRPIPRESTGLEMERVLPIILRALTEKMPSFENLTSLDLHSIEKNLREKYSMDFLRFYQKVLKGDLLVAEDFSRLIRDSAGEREITETHFFYTLLKADCFIDAYGLVSCLRRYESLKGRADFRSSGDRVREQCLAVMRATVKLEDECKLDLADHQHPVQSFRTWQGVTKLSIKNTGLAELILNRPQDMEKIVDIVVTQRVTTPNTILGLLEGLTPAMAEGAL
jgi:hypothetical protein